MARKKARSRSSQRLRCGWCGTMNRGPAWKKLEDIYCWSCGEMCTVAGTVKHGRVVPAAVRENALKVLAGVCDGQFTPYQATSAYWKALGKPPCPEGCERFDKPECNEHGRAAAPRAPVVDGQGELW